MNYSMLTDTQQQQIALRKLLDLESEHATLELSIRLAVAAEIENDNVVNARNQALILARQIAILTGWILPPATADPGTEDVAPANGQDPVLAD